jgi:hypothetical protein
MKLFNLFSKKIKGPYQNEGLNKIYDLLFCDNIDLYKSETKSLVYPWDVLLANVPDVDKLEKMSTDNSLESRQRIIAYNLLLGNGILTSKKELLGVIVEVALLERIGCL